MTSITLFFPAGRLGQEALTFAEGRPEPLLSTEDLCSLASQGAEIGLWVRAAHGEAEDLLMARLRQERAALAGALDAPVEVLATASSTPGLVHAAKSLRIAGLASDGHGFFGARAPTMGIPRFAVGPEATLLELALVVGRRVGQAAW